MKTMNLFVVKVDKPINDTMKTDGGLELFVDTRFNEFEHRQVFGEVVSAPLLIENDVEPGDTLYFHHLVVVEGGQKIPWEDKIHTPHSITFNFGIFFIQNKFIGVFTIGEGVTFSN